MPHRGTQVVDQCTCLQQDLSNMYGKFRAWSDRFLGISPGTTLEHFENAGIH